MLRKHPRELRNEARNAAALFDDAPEAEAPRESSSVPSPPIATEYSPVACARVPPAKLRDYLGPTAVRTAMGLAEGEYSEVLPGVGGSSDFFLFIPAHPLGYQR